MVQSIMKPLRERALCIGYDTIGQLPSTGCNGMGMCCEKKTMNE